MLPYTLQYPSAACQVLGGSQTCPTVVRARRGAGSERPQVYETFRALQASCGLYATSWAAWREARIQAVVDQEWPTTRKQGHSKPIGTSSGGRRSRSVPLIDWAWKIRPDTLSCAAARPGGSARRCGGQRASAPRMTKLVATRAWIERAACRHVTHGCMAVRGLDPCEFTLLRSARSAAVTASTGCSLAEGRPAGRAAYTVTLRLPRHGG